MFTPIHNIITAELFLSANVKVLSMTVSCIILLITVHMRASVDIHIIASCYESVNQSLTQNCINCVCVCMYV